MSRAALAAVLTAAAGAALPVAPPPRPAGDWPMFGRTPGRNMAHPAATLPPLPDAGPDCGKPADVAAWSARWVRWTADLGGRAYGGPVVAGGRVYVGTNNERPRNPARDVERIKATGEVCPIDKGVLMCFAGADGTFLWQTVFDRPEFGGVNGWPREGVVGTPAVDGDRVYLVTNRCTVVCLDANGFADGNQGARAEKYTDPTDADVLWEYDLIREQGVHPHCVAGSSPLVVGGLVFAVTGNGVDDGHVHLPAPEAPSLVALDKYTGKLVWKDASPGTNILHGQWSSPAYAADPVPQVIAAQGDGWVRAFDPPTGRLLWAFDANAKDAVYELGGRGTKCDFLAAPVAAGGRLYIGLGQDPEHTDGPGRYWCLDLARAVAGGRRNPGGDVSPELVVQRDGPKVVTRPNPDSAAAWMFGAEDRRPFAVRRYTFGRTLSTACLADDVLYVGGLQGFVHALDARTGRPLWRYDTGSSVWGSCLSAGGRVLIGTDGGDLYVFRHDPRPEVTPDQDDTPADLAAARASRRRFRAEVERKYLVGKIAFDAPIRTTPVVAGGTLYVMTEKTLYALGRPE